MVVYGGEILFLLQYREWPLEQVGSKADWRRCVQLCQDGLQLVHATNLCRNLPNPVIDFSRKY